MDVEIRLEREEDFRETEVLTRESFWDVYMPGCVEHLLVHKLRTDSSFVKELDFVAIHSGRVVGNIMFSRAKIIDEQNNEHEVLTLAPVSVLPEFQRKGIGSKLILYGIAQAKKMNFKAIILFGAPEYYQRFGFVNAEKYNIKTSDGQNFDAFMVLELYKDSLKGVEGRYFEPPVFQIDKQEVDEFEKKFPYKEKHITPTQLRHE